METKRAYVEDEAFGHDDKKAHTKPGRKPIETEPKSKRTAQNRAAQRAYRERKERKMKDLEDKVADLEDANVKAVSELDLLKAQIDLLKRELSRYRGHTDFTDLNLPQKVGKLTQPNVKRESSDSLQDLSLGFPWSKENLNSDYTNDSASSNLPDLVSGSSANSTPNEITNVSPDSNSSDSNQLNLNLSPQNQFNIATTFEEQVDPFCVKLNEACGTKLCPVPKYKRSSNEVPPVEYAKYDTALVTLPNTNSPFNTLFTPNENLSDPFFTDGNFNFSATDGGDPLSFLNDNNFDVSLAFGNVAHDVVESGKEEDPLEGLTTEDSAYDAFSTVNTDFNFNEFVKSSLPSDISSRSDSVSENHKPASSVTSFNTTASPAIAEDDENEVVPAPERTIKCAEIWDRITSHPRYTDIDIDGLCNELKSKAKCSEKGVVLDAKDVNQLIERSAIKR